MYKLKAAEWRPQHFKWEVKDRVATITLNRPERKNPLTLESYAELRDTFHKLQYAEDVRVGGVHRRRRQFLLGRRRARNHRAAHQDGYGRAARVHADDREPGEGNAHLPAADHLGSGRRVRRRRRDRRDGERPALRHARMQDGVPLRARRACRLRHGRLLDPAAHHRPGSRVGTALHRARHDRPGRPGLGLLQRPRAHGQAARQGACHGEGNRRRPDVRAIP